MLKAIARRMTMKEVKTKTLAEARKHFNLFENTTSKLVGDYWITTLTPKDDPIYTRGYSISWSPIRGANNKATSNKKK